MVDGPFGGIGIETLVDDTLPPDHVKFLHGDDQASVFRLDLESESSELVATWPEKAVRRDAQASSCWPRGKRGAQLL
jgi:hypothetical protein